MPIFQLDDRLIFPPPQLAEPDGVLAIGGDLRPERLLLAYQQGIFPWYGEGLPIIWHSPDPRTVLEVASLKVSHSLRKTIRRGVYQVRLDTAFDAVVDGCATAPRAGQPGTWITDDVRRAYGELHRMGYAHSAEAWRDGELVGGLYGVSLGEMFFGESMFAHAPDASKVAFVTLVEQLGRWGIGLVDCQVQTAHLTRFGAVPWPRSRFLSALKQAVRRPTRRGVWALEKLNGV